MQPAIHGIHGLYLITSEELAPGRLLLEKCQAALDAGCALLQYRNKTSPTAQRWRDAEALAELCGRYRAKLIINDDVALARTLKTGVHLGLQDSALGDAKQQLLSGAVIGATCHGSLELARRAQGEGATYLAFGRFFPSRTKPDAPEASLDLLQKAKAELRLPLVAIGGIDLDNAPSAITAGADAIALCHDVFAMDAKAIAQRVAKYQSLFA